MNLQGLQKITGKIGGFVSKNSPTILTGMGVAGVVTTVILAIRATPRAIQIIEAEEEYLIKKEGTVVEPLSNMEIIKLTWKCYIPTTIMGISTIACIIGANNINIRRNAALASLYSLSETALKEYQNKVVEKIGEKKEREIKDDIAKDRIQKDPVSDDKIILTGKGETLCYDAISGRYFKSDIEFIRKVLNDLSRDLMSENTITLNQVYDGLGLSQTKMGDLLEWNIDDGLIDPSFSAQLTDNGTPCLVLDFDTQPRYVPCY